MPVKQYDSSIHLASQQLNRNRVGWHLLFWVVYFVFHGTLWGSFDNNYVDEFIIAAWQLPVKMVATYFLLYYLLPKHLLLKHYNSFIVVFLLSAFLFAILQRMVIYFFIYPAYFPDKLSESVLLDIPITLYGLVNIYSVAAVAASIKLLKQWYYSEKVAQQLAQEKLEAELKFLKSQIHPHFLFNTLNNLYALTLKKSDTAPEIVLKLSDLLDYMLYEANVKRISLGKELKLIENYIALEKLRYGERLKIQFQKTGPTNGKQIAPMLILPFVENAFKHGISGELNKVTVSMQLETDENYINFNIENSKDPIQSKDEGGYTEGIGLKNVKRRLELLYPQNHQLVIKDHGHRFYVNLKISTQ